MYRTFRSATSMPVISANLLRSWQWFSFIFLLGLPFSDALSAERNTSSTPANEEIRLDNETDLPLDVYSANGPYRLLWIPGYATPADAIALVAHQLNEKEIEVWHADILEARFLPKTASSIYKIRENDIISIINAANAKDRKKLFIYVESRAVIPILLALRKLQSSGTHLKNFGGVIMNAPYFFVETPSAGIQAQLMPIVSATNLPIYVIQPKNSPRYWQLAQSIPALEKSGSDVFIHVLPEIRGRFLFRPDSTSREDALTQQFGQIISQAFKYLETVNNKKRIPASQKLIAFRNASGKKDRSLEPYLGNPEPPFLELENLAGHTVNLKNFPNQVILVNFWATWCPPCVKEMPSLQRLSQKLHGDQFIILGVNIAESKATINDFLAKKINVDFPILMDLNGNVMRQWNVMAFPTSFVIDKHGKIRFALFGSIDWDTPEITKKIQTLMDE